jgi:two-component system, cell cycle response regulator
MTGRFRVGATRGAPETHTGTDWRPAAPRRRILVIDDDAATASTLVDCLEPAGYTVDVSADGTEGVRRALAAPPDLIVLDVNLPPTDGFDAAARIRKSPRAKEIPILFVSGVRDLAVRMRRLAIDDVDFLRKPFGLDELLTRIERVLNTARARQALHRQAEGDALTGLGNLRRFQTRLADEHARFARYAEALSLVAIDVDKLKRINDEHGHPAGNQALRAIAEVLGREVRDVDVAARCGGDEFLVILPHTTLPHAAVFADRVLNAVRRVSVLGLQLSVSIGVASLNRPGSAESTDQLLQRADAAAYRAKRAGGDRICLAHDDEPG